MKGAEQGFLLPSAPSPIRDAMARAAEREGRGLPVVDFSSGNVGKLPYRLTLFKRVDIEVNEGLGGELRLVAEALRRGLVEAFYPHPGGLGYSPTGGTNPVKGPVMRYFREVHGVPLGEGDFDRVIVTAGGQQCMAAALRSIRPGRDVFLPRWDYSSISDIVRGSGCRETRIRVGEDLSLDLADAEERLTRGSVFYLSMPNNPTGYVSAEDLGAVARLMEEREGGLIWDAPYLFTILRLTSTGAEFDREFLKRRLGDFRRVAEKHYGGMCILSSISKTCLMAGLRFGFATASPRWIDVMNSIIGRENLSSPTPSFTVGAHALRMFLDNPVTHEWTCRVLAERLTNLIEEGLPLILPGNGQFGALYVLVRTPGVDGARFATRLIERHGIVTVAGSAFYGEPVEAVRLSLVATPWTEGDEEWRGNVKALKRALEGKQKR